MHEVSVHSESDERQLSTPDFCGDSEAEERQVNMPSAVGDGHPAEKDKKKDKSDGHPAEKQVAISPAGGDGHPAEDKKKYKKKDKSDGHPAEKPDRERGIFPWYLLEEPKGTTDTSAVGGDQGKRSGSSSHSQRPRSRSPVRLRSRSRTRFGSVFDRGSVLRQLLDNVQLSDFDISNGPRPRHSVLFLFDSSYDDARLQEHYWPSMTKMKDQLHDASFQFGRLLDDVHKRIGARNRCPRKDMLGLLSKFNLQYRRPYPANCDFPLDVWKPCHAAVGAQLSAPYFNIDACDLESTVVLCRPCSDDDIDRNGTNSMVAHTFSGKMVRTVVGISFPALCLLLQEEYSAVDIERAWTEMPMVRRGKPHTRGTSNRNSGRK